MNAPKCSDQAGVYSRRSVTIAFFFCFLGLLADGADLMFLAYTLNSLTAEFHLSHFEAGLLGSVTLAGMAIGGICGGWCCDRFGRVRVVTWAIVIFSAGTTLLGLTHSYWQFALIRLLSSLGLGSLFVACNILMSEFVTTKYRTTILATMQAGWTVGYLVATVLAGQIIPEFGWRALFFTALVPALICLALRPWVPESPSWLASRAEHGRPVADGSLPGAPSGAQILLGDKSTRRMFLLWTLTACFLMFGYYGTNNWMPSYLESELGMNFKSMTGYMLGAFSAMILGKVGAGIASDYFGRRLTFVVGAIGTALFMPVIVFWHTPGNILWIMTLFGLIYGVSMGVVATYMTESFSTRVRGAAVGTAYNIGRIGAAVAPAVIGLLASHISIGAGFLVMGITYVITGLIPALFIPDRLYDPSRKEQGGAPAPGPVACRPADAPGPRSLKV
ncbi:AAHS family cis,cis-muconate transporter-like MFS transporter [Pseudomonas citronellolis]|uniref:MFS transporter n=1 Tax=Pseudomonas citronellolis TaxID=53408 RepID=UPI0020A137C1|nr:MFS transporter [Pseudomonas citronellolis]MCP1645005.1 AAHS family cis,cis-muconate transporter-like MFS transporter [Pseudomonas citronellolis]MCP1667995.1 AAHS family cis,cis-muconate transporter-like MFS transporter [Pseudomonas citronellolis]MCP1699159.1 AAHS family cis,cis-muconate transporter-like MFS transporter [Pseudomonas citronellolis]MCP1705690.1 AAHS family cis,cis-muconate transporter-like MFS transporter [Pseudomonas citronellolis]MCP1799723.1 AAHS family cis,cis-muconate tr